MKRLTVHLKNVKKSRVDGKEILRNTLSFRLNGPKFSQETSDILKSLENSGKEVTKYYFSNVI